MSMSIGQLMKGLIGDAQPGDGKALELKVGQTVRGVLVKMTGDREGIVQINGTPVEAKLEAPLEPGKAALLQVQPESADGALVLKPADPKTAAIPEASVKEWIKALGLPDTKASADLVGELRKDGVVFDPRDGRSIPSRARRDAGRRRCAVLDAGGRAGFQARAADDGRDDRRASAGSCRSAGACASGGAGGGSCRLERPSRGTGRGGVRAAAWGGASGRSEAAGATGRRRGADARSAAGGRGEAARGFGGRRAQPAAAGAGKGAPEGMDTGKTPVEVSASITGGRQQANLNPVILPRLSETGDPAGASKKAGAPAANLSSAQRQVIEEAPAWDEARSSAGRALQQPNAFPESAPSRQQSNSTVAINQRNNIGPATQASKPGQTASPNVSQTSPQDGSGTSWLGQMMKWIGVDHERMLATATIQQEAHASAKASATEPLAAADGQAAQAMKAASDGRMPTSAGQGRAASLLFDRNQQQTAALASIIQDSVAPHGEGTKAGTADTLKSALLNLAASDDVPQPLRDTAQQLVSHITGQQLLLSPEKNGSLFSHVTLFIPMKGPDGSQTASVHIQTRRGRKGELDGDNCRLLFDLRMKTLGETVVDVQVVNKIVNLHVWNDHPASEQLIDASDPS